MIRYYPNHGKPLQDRVMLTITLSPLAYLWPNYGGHEIVCHGAGLAKNTRCQVDEESDRVGSQVGWLSPEKTVLSLFFTQRTVFNGAFLFR